MNPSIRPSRALTLMLLGSGLLIPSLACSTLFPSESAETETTAPKEAPTAKASFTPTVAEDLSPEEWPVVFSDSFDEDTGIWDTEAEEGEYAFLDPSIADGKFTVEMTAKDSSFYYLTPDLGDLDDFLVSVEVEKVSGATDADYGLVFRLDEGYYSYQFTEETQEYSVYLFIDGDWELIVDYTYTEAIDPSGPNRIAVLAQGSEFTLFINDQEVGTFQDQRSPSGMVGLGINLIENGDTVLLEFDDFEVKAPHKPR